MLLKSQNIKIKYFYELNFTHRRPLRAQFATKKVATPDGVATFVYRVIASSLLVLLRIGIGKG